MKRFVCTLILASVAAPFVVAPAAHAATPRAHPASTTGTLTGVITDAETRKPLAHVLLTIGDLTKGYQRAAETDANGHYTITNLPLTKAIDAYAFKSGYFYYHGSSAINAGTTTYSHILAHDTTSVSHPQISYFYAMPPTKGVAHFGMRAQRGNGPFSFEMMAISPQLGRLVVLEHGPSDHYDGKLSIDGVKDGQYTFYYVATQENCFENKVFPSKSLHL